MKKELNILITLVLIWCIGLIAAPYFSGSRISVLLYRLYSVVCHQYDSRSFHIHGNQFAVCIRCTSIYMGFLLALIVVRLSIHLRATYIQPILLLFISSIPMLIDGSLSLLNIRESTTMSRIVTGSIFGIGMALLLHHTLTEIVQFQLIKRIKKNDLKT